MANQDLIYSVLARPLGNQVAAQKQQVKEVSETPTLKQIAHDEQPKDKYSGAERRKKQRERRATENRRNDQVENSSVNEKGDSGLDLYA